MKRILRLASALLIAGSAFQLQVDNLEQEPMSVAKAQIVFQQ